ncbi:hypothetical protein Tco_0749118 [Tanacetum coccineum]|uniref:Uncharacterized protein n=1 Tax=Tanacetum coccineum TaxID=301880 RepID=A0ABQ4YY92_9ASTR
MVLGFSHLCRKCVPDADELVTEPLQQTPTPRVDCDVANAIDELQEARKELIEVKNSAMAASLLSLPHQKVKPSRA